MISCDKIEEIISLALDGEASESEIETLDAHLRDCAACRAYRARQLQIDGALEAALGGYRQALSVPGMAARRGFGILYYIAAAALLLAATGLGGFGGYLMSKPAEREVIPGRRPTTGESLTAKGRNPATRLPAESEPCWESTEATIPIAEELVWDSNNGLKTARHYRRRSVNTVRIPKRDFEFEWGSTDHEVKLVSLEE